MSTVGSRSDQAEGLEEGADTGQKKGGGGSSRQREFQETDGGLGLFLVRILWEETEISLSIFRGRLCSCESQSSLLSKGNYHHFIWC